MNIDIEEMSMIRQQLKEMENKIVYNKMNPSQYYKKFVSYIKRNESSKTYAFIVNVLDDKFEVRYICPSPPIMFGILGNTFVKFDDIFCLEVVEQEEIEKELLKVVDYMKI